MYYVFQNIHIVLFISSKSRISKTSCFNIRPPRHEFEHSRLSISFSDEGKSEMEIITIVTSSIYIIEYHKDISLHYRGLGAKLL